MTTLQHPTSSVQHPLLTSSALRLFTPPRPLQPDRRLHYHVPRPARTSRRQEYGMINRVVLVGRLTRDPELRTTTTGKSVVDFSLAVTKRMKPQDGSPDADFFRVNAWGATAEYVANYLTKGRLV